MSLVGYQDALAAVRRLVEVARAGGHPAVGPLVLLGGSALAARGVRDLSMDVDLYAPGLPPDTVHAVERELCAVHGPAFRLDVTAGENLWGSILVRDVADAPVVATLDVAGRRVEVRALTLEDVFLLKLAAGRQKDLDDLALIGPRTTPELLCQRFATFVRWHGDRGAVMGFADAFVVRLGEHFGVRPRDVIPDLGIPEYVRAALFEAYP